MISFNKIFSTSSPTYPASVKVVASAVANGTSRIFASVLKNIKKGLDKDKRICYNKYIGKQKKYFRSQGIAGLTK